jgi:signal transduction histidine kinase
LTLAQLFVGRATFALENARLYEQAQRAIQARDDVLAFLSHDLGNPLAAIRIASAVLMRRLVSSTDTAEARQVLGIRQAVEQMQRLISDLLDVRRLEAGQLRLNREQVSVSGLLHEGKAMVEAIAAEKQIDVAVDVEKDLPSVTADRERLLQVLSNLLGNALKYSSERTRVNVSARREGNALIVDVADQGQGINAADLPYIFDRYWQARRRGAAGHGLGLAIVHGVVEAHGGRVWAESKPGIGSRFTFSIPL